MSKNLLSPLCDAMSSREISAVTGRSHTDVLRDIKIMFSVLGLGAADCRRDIHAGYVIKTDATGGVAEIVLNHRYFSVLFRSYPEKVQQVVHEYFARQTAKMGESCPV